MYPEPAQEDPGLGIADREMEPGQEFRYYRGKNRITNEDRWGLAYLLRVEGDRLVFFNVTEEWEEDLSIVEVQKCLDDDVLHMLDSTWTDE